MLYFSLYLRDDAGDAGQLARVAAGDDVRAADHAGRGGLHALVGAHHRHHEHERSHHQRRTLCGLLRTHRARLSHRPWIQRLVLNQADLKYIVLYLLHLSNIVFSHHYML